MNKKIKDIFDKIDFAEMLEKVDKGALASSMSKIENQLHLIKATGEAGGGLVRVEIDGHRKVYKSHIDKSLLDPKNKSMVEDLIVAAINIANKNVESAIEEKAMEGDWNHLVD
ncbi:MAG: YbaB/EbfC family nucleoid-associated protein [Bacteroidota bacterium]